MALGSQPIPAFCDKPNRSPQGQSRNISSVSGSDPRGPSAVVATSYSAGLIESTSVSESSDGVAMKYSVQIKRDTNFRPVGVLPLSFDSAPNA